MCRSERLFASSLMKVRDFINGGREREDRGRGREREGGREGREERERVEDITMCVVTSLEVFGSMNDVTHFHYFSILGVVFRFEVRAIFECLSHPQHPLSLSSLSLSSLSLFLSLFLSPLT